MLSRINSTGILLILAVFINLNQCSANIYTKQENINDLFIDKPLDKTEIGANAFLKWYEQTRKDIIEYEEEYISGGDTILTQKEQKVNHLFMNYKLEELSVGFENPSKLAAGMHFFDAKPLIDESYVFKFLKAMPKGGLLHLHNAAAVSSKWVISNLTYMTGMLKCITKNDVTILTFRQNLSKHNCRTDYYTVVADERNAANSPADFDAELEKTINLYTPTPAIDYSSIDVVWTKFNNMFDTIGDALKYVPAYKKFYWRMMEEMYEDNVMEAEMRMNFKELYDANNIIVSVDEAINILIDLIRDFKDSHPGFFDIKVIYTTQRLIKGDELRTTFDTFKVFHQKYPQLIVGFDFIGQEDKGKRLHDFVDILQQDMPKTAKYFFHAGETNWYGTTSDLNLVDALLMNTTRIGHGYALMKHPLLIKEVKERGICLEVCPISNQVLHLVADLRNHPAGYFIAQDIPMVISNDNPGFWNGRGVSYDYYSSIMSLAPANAGIRTLKHLVSNTIKCSALTATEKTKAFRLLQTAWDVFIDKVLDGKVF